MTSVVPSIFSGRHWCLRAIFSLMALAASGSSIRLAIRTRGSFNHSAESLGKRFFGVASLVDQQVDRRNAFLAGECDARFKFSPLRHRPALG